MRRDSIGLGDRCRSDDAYDLARLRGTRPLHVCRLDILVYRDSLLYLSDLDVIMRTLSEKITWCEQLQEDIEANRLDLLEAHLRWLLVVAWRDVDREREHLSPVVEKIGTLLLCYRR